MANKDRLIFIVLYIR